MRSKFLPFALVAALLYVSGCDKAKPPPTATAQDVDDARQEAQRQVAEARTEASKDIKSAARVSGSDTAVVSQAKVTGAYDVAMTKADGDRKVAAAQCMTLQPDLQKPCTNKADADYEVTAAAAKAARLGRER